MSSDPSTILFPVRSNAKSLVTGGALNTVRQRIKVASLLHDEVLLEAGVAVVQAGPRGGSSMWHPVRPGETVRWQTPRERGAAQASPFVIMVGQQSAQGVPAEKMVPLIQSDATVSWWATLEPFRAELPAACNWIEWFHSRDPDGDARRLLDEWIRHDERNTALERAIPERFVRSRVVANADRDLLLAVDSGCAASLDSLHVRVVANRFEDEHNDWRLTGYALPMWVPDVAELPWDAVAAIRADKGMQRLRAVLAEIEAETSAVAVRGGDLEAAVHHAVEKRLRMIADKGGTFGSATKQTMIGFVIGATSSVATMGITGPLGSVAGAALASVVGGVGDVRAIVRDRRARQWIGVVNRLHEGH